MKIWLRIGIRMLCKCLLTATKEFFQFKIVACIFLWGSTNLRAIQWCVLNSQSLVLHWNYILSPLILNPTDHILGYMIHPSGWMHCSHFQLLSLFPKYLCFPEILLFLTLLIICICQLQYYIFRFLDSQLDRNLAAKQQVYDNLNSMQPYWNI